MWGSLVSSGLITFHWEIRSQNIKTWDDRKNTSAIVCFCCLFSSCCVHLCGKKYRIINYFYAGCDLAPQHPHLRVHTFSYPSSCPSFQLSNYEKKPTRTWQRMMRLYITQLSSLCQIFQCSFIIPFIFALPPQFLHSNRTIFLFFSFYSCQLLLVILAVALDRMHIFSPTPLHTHVSDWHNHIHCSYICYNMSIKWILLDQSAAANNKAGTPPYSFHLVA